MNTVDGYAGWDRAALDRQYSPSSRIPSLQVYLDEYARSSALARRRWPVRTDLRYGPTAAEVLDYFPGATRDAPVQVFVHGGNWQELTKESSAFAAEPFLRSGAAFVAVDYGLAPAVPLDGIVAMVRRCVAWLPTHAAELGFDPRRIHLSGSSAGAHLVAMALVSGASGSGLVAGATLLSGIYDLEPVRHCYVNAALRLDADAARRHSPAGQLPSRLPPVIIARGGNETDEYVRQHDLMAAALRPRTRLTEVVAPDRNHFDLPYDLGVPGTELGDAVLAQMGLAGTATRN
jgi:arylformamidase